MSKTDPHLLRQKVGQIFSEIKTNTCDDITKIVYFGISIHVLSWRQQKRNDGQSIIEVVERLCLKIFLITFTFYNDICLD